MKTNNQLVKECRARKEFLGLRRYDIWTYPELKEKIIDYIHSLHTKRERYLRSKNR